MKVIKGKGKNSRPSESKLISVTSTQEPDLNEYGFSIEELLNLADKEFGQSNDTELTENITITAWNIETLKNYDTLLHSALMQTVTAGFKGQQIVLKTFKKIMALKEKKFSHLELFILEMESRIESGKAKFDLVLGSKEKWLEYQTQSMFDGIESMDEEYLFDLDPKEIAELQFEEGNIDRTVLVVNPTPIFESLIFLKTGASLAPSGPSIYLIPETDNPKEIQKWVKKNYSQIIWQEIRYRNIREFDKLLHAKYAEFKQWFSVEVGDFAHDFHVGPVVKNTI